MVTNPIHHEVGCVEGATRPLIGFAERPVVAVLEKVEAYRQMPTRRGHHSTPATTTPRSPVSAS